MGALISHPTRVHFADPVYIEATKSRGSEQSERTSLRALVESRCPSLFSTFEPAWWLFNGHLQTVYCVLGDFSKTDKVIYDRKYLRMLDGGTLGLDFTPVNDISLKDDTPIIVVSHGLTGGSYEAYVRAILAPACSPPEEGGLGYRAVVVNFRGCAGVPITSPQLYSAGHTDDLRQALIYITKLFPRAPLLGLGFSLGANVMTRYIAEEGDQSRLVSGCALACPWNLAKNNSALNSTLIGKYVYSKGMGGNLLRLLRHHLEPLSRDPEHRVGKALTAAMELKSPTLEEFDQTFTRIAGGSAPTFPFDTAMDYYHWGSSHKVIGDIKVPFLSLNAGDDPVVQDVPMGSDNVWTIMALTPKGGHLGWFESGDQFLGVRRWVTKPVLEWLKMIAEDVVRPDPAQRPPLYVDDDGFLKEIGRDDIGCKEVEGGGMIDGNEGEEGLLQGL